MSGDAEDLYGQLSLVQNLQLKRTRSFFVAGGFPKDRMPFQ